MKPEDLGHERRNTDRGRNLVTIRDKQFALYLSKEVIRQRVREMAEELDQSFKYKDPIFVGVLNGAFIFLSDLIRTLTISCEVDFVKLSSYGNRTESSREVRELKKVDADLTGREVVLVEDIVDTGRSMKHISRSLNQLDIAGLTLVSLLDKPSRREVDVDLDLVGFEIPDRFVVGYGLDYAQHGRELPAIYSDVHSS